MSDTLNETEVSEITLDDLDYYWTESGLPVFIANRDDICDVVEQMGFSIYYLLGNLSKVTTSSSTNPTTKQQVTTTSQTKSISLIKVVNNFVGRTVSASTDIFDNNIISVEEQALYTMPPIPHILVDKLDQFFRLVDAQHGTESIVMLTYDTTKEGPDGWGILVPDQSNTSVHCNYDPHSVAVLKPDNVMIVGSVHSHPGMSAYASGTDHKDQADFDGLHITYGWQRSVNNGATQYHIELQMAGKAYTLQPEDVFQDYTIEKEPDPEVVEWSSKVKKVLPPSLGGTGKTSTHPVPQTTGGTATLVGGVTRFPSVQERVSSFSELRDQFGNNQALSLEPNCIIVAEIEKPLSANEVTACPSCAVVIDIFNFQSGYCDYCYMPIVEKNSTFEQIIKNVENYCYDLYESDNVPVYLWSINDDNTQSLIKICETNIGSTLNDKVEVYSDSSELYDKYDEKYSTSFFSQDYTLCCGKQIVDNVVPCKCDPFLTREDVLTFDEATRFVQLYDKTSLCVSCEYYYDINCPKWKDVLIKFVSEPDLNIASFENSLDNTNCNFYEPYNVHSSNYSSPYSDWD